jgi:hypothetical protein
MNHSIGTEYAKNGSQFVSTLEFDNIQYFAPNKPRCVKAWPFCNVKSLTNFGKLNMFSLIAFVQLDGIWE